MSGDETRKIRDNKLSLQKGTINGKQLRFLGHVNECYGEDCPAYELCSFRPKKDGRKCAVVDGFIKSIYQGLVDPTEGLGDSLSQMQLDRVGLHLVPLYQQLIRFCLGTYTLKDTTYVEKSGKINVHPLFKEIREVQSCIAKEIKEIGLNEAWEKKFKGNKTMPTSIGFSDQDIDEMLTKGRKGAYEELLTD